MYTYTSIKGKRGEKEIDRRRRRRRRTREEEGKEVDRTEKLNRSPYLGFKRGK